MKIWPKLDSEIFRREENLSVWRALLSLLIFFSVASVNFAIVFKPDQKMINQNQKNQQIQQIERTTQVKPFINRKPGKNQQQQKIVSKVNADISDIFLRKFPKLKSDEEKQKAVLNSFKEAWNAYKKYAWGKDFLQPITKDGKNVFFGGLSITDSLDTLYLLGLNDEIEECKKWIKENFKFNGKYSIFEINIRHLASFISMYQQTGDKFYLDKAVYVADALLPTMNTPKGYFKTYGMFNSGEKGKVTVIPSGDNSALISDIGGIQLEFYSLSMITGDPKYAKAASRIHKNLFADFTSGLIPERVRITNGEQCSTVQSWDSMSDSYYEYLIKVFLLSGGSQQKYLDEYLKAADEGREKLVVSGQNHTFLARLNRGIQQKIMSHLVTFVPGMLALGAVKSNPHASDDLKLADKLVSTFANIYHNEKTGLMPEVIRFHDDRYNTADRQYQLRPETIESLFYMYRMTGLPKYRDYAWQIYQSIEKYCKVEGAGYTTITNTARPGSYGNLQDSYFLAETLKYLYLIFSDDNTLPITQYVFNTEAHPLKIWTPDQAEQMKKAIDV